MDRRTDSDRGGARRPRASRGRRRSVALGLILGLGLVGVAPISNPSASAASAVVACDGDGDIAAVQDAIDAAGPGDTVALSGTCDFSGAPAHGGDVASVDAAAVVVRPGAPVTDLTITSAGAPHSATIVGGGEETAFALVPGNDRITISGLRFANLARPVFAAGVHDLTVGAAGGLPSPQGNQFVGNESTDSSVLAVATDQAMAIAHGAGGSGSHVVTAGSAGSLRDLVVEGNSITYSAPGPAGPAGVRDVVAVDVRQRGTGIVDGVIVARNAVGMFPAEGTGFRHNAVRVEGLTPVAASTPPSPSDYRITGVHVAENNLGRLERLRTGAVNGLDPDDTHAAGRAAVVLVRVHDFVVRANEVRARLSASGPAGHPGGGVVVSDSMSGSIEANDVSVVGTSTVPSTADLGGVAVVEGIPALFGGSPTDQATGGVDVTANEVGRSTGSGAGRGLVVSGADAVAAWGNDVLGSSAAALHVGADVRGPDGSSLARTVTRSTLCRNTLDGVEDDPAEVSFAPGSTPSTGNAFPGGPGPDNLGCFPTVSVNPAAPTAVQPGGTLTVSGRTWATRSVDVTIDDGDGGGTPVTASATGSDLAAHSFTFSDADLAGLSDGFLTVTVLADTGGPFEAEVSAQARLNLDTTDPEAGTADIIDDDGFVNAEEIVAETVKGTWTAPGPPADTVTIWWSDGAGDIPASKCGPFTAAVEGHFRLPRQCGEALPDGSVLFHVVWNEPGGDASSEVTASITKDSTVVPPTVDQPLTGSTVTSSPVTVAGGAEPGASVRVSHRRARGEWASVATVTADSTDGTWQTSLALAEGDHEVTAAQTDPAGNRSASRVPVVEFTLDEAPTDTTPPADPTITSPPENALRPGRFDVSGTGEPGSGAVVWLDASPDPIRLRGGAVKANGTWTIPVQLPTGTHQIFATAVDAAGNESGPSPLRTVQVDAGKPSITVTTPDETVFEPGDSFGVEGTASDPESGISLVVVRWFRAGTNDQVAVDTSACLDCPGGSGDTVNWASSPNLPPGVYDVVARSVDAAFNVAEARIRVYKLSL